MDFKDILNNIDEIKYIIKDLDNNIISFNVDKNLLKIVNNRDSDTIYDKKNNKWYKYEFKKIKNKNNFYNMEYLIDITEFKNMEEKFRHDSLTTLLNRTSIVEYLDKTMSDIYLENVPVSIAIGDIDHFKYINDKYGHPAGDKVLETIGKLLKTNIGENEYIGRYGGEEFLFFFKNISNEESIRIIEKIRNDIKNLKINYNGEIIENITMSFGVCQLTSLTDVKKNDLIKLRGELISFADHALYKSKNDGRNTTHIFNKENGMIKRVV